MSHLSCNDGLVLRGSRLPERFLLNVKVIFLPGAVLRNSVRDSFVHLEIKEAAIDVHDMLRESGFGKKGVCNKFLSFLNETSVSNILLPNSKNFGKGVRLEEPNIGNDVEKSWLVHPVWKPDNLCGSNIFSAFCLELLPHFFRVDFNNTVSWDGVVLIKDHFLLVFVGTDDLKVVGSELFCVDHLDTIDEFNGRGVSILGEEWDGGFSILDVL